MTETAHIDLLLQAISYAVRVHVGQLRKDGQTPYAAHPMRVMTVLALIFKVHDPELLAAAALHDTIEDTTTDFDDLSTRFGTRVAQYVALLTKDMRLVEAQRELAYEEALAAAPAEVQLCKLADAYDNLSDARSLSSAHRERTVRKTRNLLQLLQPSLELRWPHALEAVHQQLERLVAVSPGDPHA